MYARILKLYQGHPVLRVIQGHPLVAENRRVFSIGFYCYLLSVDNENPFMDHKGTIQMVHKLWIITYGVQYAMQSNGLPLKYSKP